VACTIVDPKMKFMVSWGGLLGLTAHVFAVLEIFFHCDIFIGVLDWSGSCASY
jgi:hypothetical protein